ncbi:hypothetical protein LCGC14_1596380 [marine sediment metagenome]|uniref:Uncharacterized protein n=1 Tax=marine sediment metagenome TaxID=412755 RepID=A0A0F9ICI5_9ZZZZ
MVIKLKSTRKVQWLERITKLKEVLDSLTGGKKNG